jgi:putative transcriptional regulator
MKIEFRLLDLLQKRGHTLYWLAKELDVDYSTIHRFKTEKAAGVSFDLLARMCEALECVPGDLLVLVDEKSESKKKSKPKG